MCRSFRFDSARDSRCQLLFPSHFPSLCQIVVSGYPSLYQLPIITSLRILQQPDVDDQRLSDGGLTARRMSHSHFRRLVTDGNHALFSDMTPVVSSSSNNREDGTSTSDVTQRTICSISSIWHDRISSRPSNDPRSDAHFLASSNLQRVLRRASHWNPSMTTSSRASRKQEPCESRDHRKSTHESRSTVSSSQASAVEPHD
jgi:hypothetical protein